MKKTKRVFIIHGWGEYHNKGWFPWLKQELAKRGFSAKVLVMKPQPPVLKKWVEIIEKSVLEVDENTYFVGHSAGCMTLLHYLSSLPKKSRAGGVVFVAGWTDDLGMDELEGFFERSLDWKEAKGHCKKFVAIYSNNDPYVKPYHAQIFKIRLDAKLVSVKSKKHFSHEEGIDKLPEALDAVLMLAR